MSATSENRTDTPAQSRTVPFVVGAYPMLPPDDEDRSGAAALYAALADLGWVDGIELPFREAPGRPGAVAGRAAGRALRPVRHHGDPGHHGARRGQPCLRTGLSRR